MRIAILGAGDMGTAIATPAAANGHEVRLWGTRFDEEIIYALRAGKPHPRLNRHLPTGVQLFDANALEAAVAEVEIVVLAVASPAIETILTELSPLIGDRPIIVSMAKGLVIDAQGRVQLISERIAEQSRCPVVAVGGPSKANEVAMARPTAVVFGSPDADARQTARAAFETRTYRVINTADITGVELAAALKNAYAIAVGIAAGLEQATGLPHHNLRAALLAEAIGEMARLVTAYGGWAETIHGLAGVGDLSVTVSAGRNRLLGELLGQEMSVRDALAMLSAAKVTIEGVAACELGHLLVRQLADQGTSEPGKFPVLEALYRILFEEAPVVETIWNASYWY
jgi:glycerol-3-phosphate dehydrogenase (NAD(P)+)